MCLRYDNAIYIKTGEFPKKIILYVSNADLFTRDPETT